MAHRFYDLAVLPRVKHIQDDEVEVFHGDLQHHLLVRLPFPLPFALRRLQQLLKLFRSFHEDLVGLANLGIQRGEGMYQHMVNFSVRTTRKARERRIGRRRGRRRGKGRRGRGGKHEAEAGEEEDGGRDSRDSRDSRAQVLDELNLHTSTWCMVHGAWCMVHGAWCMVIATLKKGAQHGAVDAAP